MAEVEAPAAITRDTLLDGRLRIDQPAIGHRAGTDAVLLQAAVPRGLSGQVYDAGAGVGTVGLAVALASPNATVTLIENEPTYLTLAEANVAKNGLADRVRIAGIDLLSRDARRPFDATADLVVTNPPFHRTERVRASPVAGRRAAHVLGQGGLGAWLGSCLALLRPKGTLILIHQAAALAECLECIGNRVGGLTLLAVHPRHGEAASRVLLRGTKGSRAPFRIAAPLVLHEGSGFTPAAACLHAGVSSLDW